MLWGEPGLSPEPCAGSSSGAATGAEPGALQSGMAIKYSFSRQRVAVNAVSDTDTGPGCKSDSGRALLIYVY